MITTTYTPKQILAFGCEPMSVEADITAGLTLNPGTVLARVTATGCYSAYDNTQTDGREQASGILADYVDTSSATGWNQVMPARMYLNDGYFNKDQLTGWDEDARADLGARDVPGRNLIILP